MSYRKIFWGVLLVLIGTLFILKNTGVIFFSWHTFWSFWPVLLILWGISVLPVKDWIKVTVSLLILILSFAGIQHLGTRDSGWHFGFDSGEDREYSTERSEADTMSQHFAEKYNPAIKYARLELNIGVGQFTIADTTSQLIEFKQQGDKVRYNMTVQDQDSASKIELSLRENNFQGTVRNDVNIRLNPNPVWDLDLEVGAAGVDFDLSGYKTRNVKISGGASDIKVKLGDVYPETTVNIEAGAASITISVPKDAGCEIVTNTFLASKEFEGFDKKSNHLYQTPGFDKMENKIRIKADAGMASIAIRRY